MLRAGGGHPQGKSGRSSYFIEEGGGSQLDWPEVSTALINWSSAVLLAAGLAVSQILLGGWWYAALAVPGYLMVGMAAVLAGALFLRSSGAPAAWCGGVALLFGGYLLWRQSASPDPYAARDDTWLLLGALSVYLTAAWQLRGDGVRWFVLGTLCVLVLGQAALAVAQFAAEVPFHPLAEWGPQLGLPRGDEAVPNRGFVSGTLASRGSLSAVLQASTFLALGMLVWGRERVPVKLVLLWVTAAGFAGLTLCLSRAAYLGVGAGLGMFALVSFFVLNRGALAHRFWLMAGALTVLAAALAVAFSVGLESIAVRLRFDALELDAYRESLWFTVAPPMLALDPWFGAGANMFDQLSLRYRANSLAGIPVHAHNDWLQLLIEYGRLGFVLGCLFFIVHLASGWRMALRLARETPPAGLLPRSTELGLVTGALAVLVAQGVHSIFDYRLHVQAPALLVALSAGWIAAARGGLGGSAAFGISPWWLRGLGLLPALAGAMLLWSVGREASPEHKLWLSMQARERGDAGEVLTLAGEGLRVAPSHPRLLMAAGEAAVTKGNEAESGDEVIEWHGRASDYYRAAARERPFLAKALREWALSRDWTGRPAEALPVHLRAIARDPDQARGYEYLGLHFWRLGRPEEAGRLLRLARRLPRSTLSAEFLKLIEQERSQAEPRGETF